MGRKSKADLYGLKEIIAKNWEGGKNTVVYVAEATNKYLEENGYKITVSREAIRRAVRSYEDEIADVRKNIEAAKAIAEILKDHPGTELAEGTIMCLAGLVGEAARNTVSFSYEDPSKIIDDAAKLAAAQTRLSRYRTQAINALEKAKKEIKTELQNAIRHDPDLLDRLYKILDSAKVA